MERIHLKGRVLLKSSMTAVTTALIILVLAETSDGNDLTTCGVNEFGCNCTETVGTWIADALSLTELEEVSSPMQCCLRCDRNSYCHSAHYDNTNKRCSIGRGVEKQWLKRDHTLFTCRS